MTEITIGELTSKYKTIDHFYEAYTRADRLLIDKEYITWGYIKNIVEGTKATIKLSSVKKLILPPR